MNDFVVMVTTGTFKRNCAFVSITMLLQSLCAVLTRSVVSVRLVGRGYECVKNHTKMH